MMTQNKPRLQAYVPQRLYNFLKEHQAQQQDEHGNSISESKYIGDILIAYAIKQGYQEEETRTADEILSDVDKLVSNDPGTMHILLQGLMARVNEMAASTKNSIKCLSF